MAMLGHVSAAMSLRYGAAVRRHRPRRVRTRPHPGQGTMLGPVPAAGPAQADAAASPTSPAGTPTGRTPHRSSPGSPAASACAPPPRAAAPTPTSASTARTSAPTPRFLPVLAAQRADTGAPRRRRSPRLGRRSRPPPAPRSNGSTSASPRLKPHEHPARQPVSRRRPRRLRPDRRRRHDVTFTAVAEQTGISRATLYRRRDLRALIEQHREPATTTCSPSPAGRPQSTSSTHALDAVAANVRRHEEQLRALKRASRAS